jgi:Amt family ammonium transporter
MGHLSWTRRLAGFALAAVTAGLIATAPLAAASPAAAQDAATAAAPPTADGSAPVLAPETPVATPAEAASPVAAAAATAAAPAEEAKPWAPDTGDTAWVLTSTALVLMMTIPGLALFYGGMVRRKNVIATVAQSFAITALVTVIWAVAGYSLAFGANANAGLNKYIGGLSNFMLSGIRMDSANSLAGTVPEYVFMMFQMTFAIITPALIAGAFAERMKFSALLLFTGLWSLVVYAPVAHWVWGGGFLGGLGVLDFAGGTVVHINAGVAGLVCALVLGRRRGFGTENMAPHNLVFTMIGASLLWVGWFGFNAGSAVGANALAGAAMANTQIATGAAALAWMVVEWVERKKPGMLGLASGAVGGLVAITPAAGFVNPQGALIIGVLAGVGCYAGAVWIKRAFRYDDSLDAFGVHGIGGVIGALLTGLLADPAINALGKDHSIVTQAVGVLGTIVWSAVASFVILMVCKYTTGLRVSEEAEVEGLDLALHGESLHEH